MSSKSNLRIDANYTEDLVGGALESFLTLISFPRQRFSIEPMSRAAERWLGADARLYSHIRGFRPFYMQFKRPTAYPGSSGSKIITDRKKLGLQTEPRSLYFPLREKRQTHEDYQHNILFRLRQRLLAEGTGDAAYVCPLFLDRSAYRTSLHWSGLRRWPRFWLEEPWDREEILLSNNGTVIRFDRIPVLAEHITIPPHEEVLTAKHRYSFTEEGEGLCFHSPKSLPDGAQALSKFLAGISYGFLERGRKITRDTASNTLSDLVKAVLQDKKENGFSTKGVDGDVIGPWFAWGDHLRTNYAVDQYAMISWDE